MDECEAHGLIALPPAAVETSGRQGERKPLAVTARQGAQHSVYRSEARTERPTGASSGGECTRYGLMRVPRDEPAACALATVLFTVPPTGGIATADILP